ncbi:hypothetical protein F5Y12DRAFT_710066 [Xylaria sp. FL1777]|nr:hypothetical protein F5Y12DRAFT_710066 [Xylaria sp. FL1777]
MDHIDFQHNQRREAGRPSYDSEISFIPSRRLTDYQWACETFERNLLVIEAAAIVIGHFYSVSLGAQFFEIFFSALVLPVANAINHMAGPSLDYEEALDRYSLNSSFHMLPVAVYNEMLIEGARLFNCLFSRFCMIIDDPANPPAGYSYSATDSLPLPCYMARLERSWEKPEDNWEYA